jgi:hypothetical protein
MKPRTIRENVYLIGAGPGERWELVLGFSAASCPFTIALLAIPLFGAALWAMRGRR